MGPTLEARGGDIGAEAPRPLDDAARRATLADFLRQRRARIRPPDVGLPAGRRRRTPGLRREEVAALAGVGTDWYTWLEQGRDVHASRQVLDALATALRLTPEDRRYLLLLGCQDNVAPDPTDVPPRVSPALRWILDDHRLGPAYVQGCRTEILAWNRAAVEVFGDFGSIPPAERTWLRLLLLDTPIRRRFVDWEVAAQDLLAAFRTSAARYVRDPDFARDIKDLTRDSPEFRRWWPRHEVAGASERRRDLLHPVVGRLSFEVTTLHVHGDPNLLLVVYSAATDSETTDKLTMLPGAADAPSTQPVRPGATPQDIQVPSPRETVRGHHGL
jgi:transcriptional regulator with XRE-family HTH domain